MSLFLPVSFLPIWFVPTLPLPRRRGRAAHRLIGLIGPLTAMMAFCVPVLRAAAQQPSPPAAPGAPPSLFSPPSPFSPPQAKRFYAPDRDYDLQHVFVDLSVDYEKRAFSGTVVNRLAPLKNLLRTVRLFCGQSLRVAACAVDGRPATFTRDGDRLFVAVPAGYALVRGKSMAVSVRYQGGSRQGAGFGQGGGGGFHWINPTKTEPARTGFWTQGETEGNRDWAPTWDYPNDFTTSETRTTVPDDFSVVGNGVLVKETRDAARKTRTFVWRMIQPHATYLLSLAAGPFDIKADRAGKTPLLYVVPRGKGNLIGPSFSDTPDMIAFYEKRFGVPYPWPKYAQNAVYDFGGGMENVSATTLGERSLTDEREGFRTMASLNAHELGHQWFGDLVTCRDWGQVWLNESFATFAESLYMEHSRGKNVYDREVSSNTAAYLREARRYKRPIATNLYPGPDAMFDSHTYPKGAVVLHGLRRLLGDDAFFRGVQLYLTRNRHHPVETSDLVRALTDASGVNVQPYFDQWVFKPGHPVFSYSWNYDEAAREVVVTVKQTQDTSDGTPLYDIPNARIGVIAAGRLTRAPAPLKPRAEQEIRVPSLVRPETVLLDPDHDFLREIPAALWTADPAQRMAVLNVAPFGPDRSEALRGLLDAEKSDEETVQAARRAIEQDSRSQFPALGSVSRLGDLKREDLRSLWRSLLNVSDFGRRAEAVAALGKLPATPQDTQTLRALVNDDRAPYAVIAAAVRALGAWDAKANADVLRKAAQMPSRSEVIRQAAYATLARYLPSEGVPVLLKAASAAGGATPERRTAAIRAMGGIPASDEPTRDALRAILKAPEFNLGASLAAAQAIAERKDTALLPDLRALQQTPPAGAPGFFRAALARILADLEQPAAPAQTP